MTKLSFVKSVTIKLVVEDVLITAESGKLRERQGRVKNKAAKDYQHNHLALLRMPSRDNEISPV